MLTDMLPAEDLLIELAVRKKSNFDGKPSLHPERKGKLNISKLKNWVEKNGGLPTYINSIATALLREHPGWTISRVIATAVNMVKKMCGGGGTGIVKKVSAAVKKAACAAVAAWEKKKVSASEEIDSHIVELSGIQEAQEISGPLLIRKAIRAEGKEIPREFLATDRETMEYMGLELTDGEWEGVNDLDIEEYVGLAETAAHSIAVAWFPVLDMAEAEHVSGSTYEKEIIRTGVITDKKSGKSIKFDGEFLKDFKRNFDAILASDGYIPVQDVTDDNRHTDRTKYQVGLVNEVLLDDPNNPTKAIARIKLDDEMKRKVDFNPKIGVSIGASYASLSEDGRPVNVIPRHVAITHRPKLKGMDAWKSLIKMSDAGEALTLDLTDADYVEETQKPVEEETTERGVEMAGEQEGTQQLDMAQIMESEEFKLALSNAVATATADKDEEITRLRNSVGEVQRNSYEQAVNLAVESYAQAGVPRMIRESAKALLLSFEAGEESKTLNLTEGEGENQSTVELTRWEAVTRLLDEVKGTIDMTPEGGSSTEEEDAGEFTGDSRKAAVSGLVNLARQNRG